MKWKFEQFSQRKDRFDIWTPTFAWWPVKLDSTDEWVWMENYELRRRWTEGYSRDYFCKWRRGIGENWDVS